MITIQWHFPRLSAFRINSERFSFHLILYLSKNIGIWDLFKNLRLSFRNFAIPSGCFGILSLDRPFGNLNFINFPLDQQSLQEDDISYAESVDLVQQQLIKSVDLQFSSRVPQGIFAQVLTLQVWSLLLPQYQTQSGISTLDMILILAQLMNLLMPNSQLKNFP